MFAGFLPWETERGSIPGMSKSAEHPHPFVARISLVGRSEGAVKNLAGFRKQHHTVPDAVNATTTAFLGKLCASELAAEAEEIYQRAKAALGYKRAEASLEVASPLAVLTTKDFVFEIAYALSAVDPGRYEVTRTLHGLGRGEVAGRPEFEQLFAGAFGGIVFSLEKGVRVEAVIDAIEALDADSDLTVSYPSDCRHCVLSVASAEANVVCDGATLEMRFPKNGSPRELVAAFAAVRSAFALTKDRVLAGLL
jgi:hypothetical protein